jgi:hypothetical protein
MQRFVYVNSHLTNRLAKLICVYNFNIITDSLIFVKNFKFAEKNFIQYWNSSSERSLLSKNDIILKVKFETESPFANFSYTTKNNQIFNFFPVKENE